MTMSAVTSLSLEPPQFLICIDHRARTLGAIKNSGSFCINFLRDDQRDLAISFSRPSNDRFGTVAYQPGETGSPVLEGVIAHVECKLHAIHPGGDHWILIGDAVAGGFHGGAPLGYYHGAYRHVKDIR